MSRQTKTPPLRQVLEQKAKRMELAGNLGDAGAHLAVGNLALIRRLQRANLLPPDLKAAIRMAADAAPAYLRIAADAKAAGRWDEIRSQLESKGLGDLADVLDRAAPTPAPAAEREAVEESSILERAAAMTPEQLDRAAAIAAANGHPNLRRDLERFQARAASRTAERAAREAAERHGGDESPAAAWLRDPAIQRDAPKWLAALGVKAGDGETPAAALLGTIRGIMDASSDHAQTVSDLAARLKVDREVVSRTLEAVSSADLLGGLKAKASERDRDEAKARASNGNLPRSELTAAEKARIERDENRRRVLENGAERLAARRVVEDDPRKAALRASLDRLEGRPLGQNWTPSKRLVAERTEAAERARSRPQTPRERMEAKYDEMAAQDAGTRSSDPKPNEETYRHRSEAEQASSRRSGLEAVYDAAAGEGGEQ